MSASTPHRETRRHPRILFAAGGTGGHVYPAIAIADAIREVDPYAVIEFAGTKERMEWTAVPKAGYAIHPITAVGLQRTRSIKAQAKNLLFPFRILKGYLESRRLVKAFDADVVVGTGGYVSGPVLRAASDLGRPLVLQEQNAYAGVTNRWLAKRASRIHIAFEAARDVFPKEKCILSGNPTRKNLQNVERGEARAHYGIPENAKVLFVFGGSLGSVVLNEAVESSLSRILELQDVHILWQTGKKHFETVSQRLGTNPSIQLLPYIDRMDLAYAASDLVVCRAGAISCSELMVTGSPALLIPSPHVAEDHQTSNARAMVAKNAAAMLAETDIQRDFYDTVSSLLRDESTRAAMRSAARNMATPHAADEIARDVLSLIDIPASGEESA